jgi:hypothetical protein
MRQSIRLKSFIIIVAGMAALGGAVFVGFRHASDVRGDTEPFGPLSETYTHAELGFSFRYPRGYTLTELPQEEQGVVVVEDPTRPRQWFQVFSMPYDEDGPLTEARIRQDVPDITMENAQPFQVADEPGISFVQFQTADVGKTYEVWFVHHGTLYEAATSADRAAALHDILSTWTFQP